MGNCKHEITKIIERGEVCFICRQVIKHMTPRESFKAWREAVTTISETEFRAFLKENGDIYLKKISG